MPAKKTTTTMTRAQALKVARDARLPFEGCMFMAPVKSASKCPKNKPVARKRADGKVCCRPKTIAVKKTTKKRTMTPAQKAAARKRLAFARAVKANPTASKAALRKKFGVPAPKK